tara:strand:- start:3 stop:1277 length:1275 start_codon:yes stop_codon:yes gene_type:complete
MKIGFIGVGKLGQACAEIIAEKHEVVGYDISKRRPANFKMGDSISEAIINKDIVFVAVQTPHDPNYDGKKPTSHLPPKDFDYSTVIEVLKQVEKFCDEGQLVALISTVLPGTVRKKLAPILKKTELIYNPYLIAMGTVKWDMVNPEMIMIGTQDGIDRSKIKKIETLYETIIQNNPRYEFGTWEEIESIKVFYNTFISAKVSLVNMIQDVAVKLGNINAEFVCDALSASTKRIMGPSYMKPGMGDGGSCHPRDNIALRHLARDLDIGYDLFDSVMLSREKQAENMAKYLCSFGLPVVIIGKTYKPLVPYIDGSSSMLVGHYVEKQGIKVSYLDKQTGDEQIDKKEISTFLMAHSPEITYGNQLDEVRKFHVNINISDADKAITASDNLSINFPIGSVIVDPWRKMPNIEGVTVIHYGNTRSINS